MGSFIDLTGQKFGKLTVLSYERKNGRTYWLCKCGCVHENITKVRADLLRNGEVKSCGKCLHNTYESVEDYVKVTTYNNDKKDSFLIDKEDFQFIKPHTWYINDDGYVCGYINKHNVFIQRFIMERYADIINKVIDHIFHNTRDNRKSKMRVCEAKDNQSNKKMPVNKTGFKGITIDKRNGNFRTSLNTYYKKIKLGIYKDLKYAIIARVQGEFKYQTEYRYNEDDKKIEEYCGMSIEEILRYDVSSKINSSKNPILQYDKQGNFIKEWIGATDAGRELGCNSQHIYTCCNGKRKTHYGFIWKYKIVD